MTRSGRRADVVVHGIAKVCPGVHEVPKSADFVARFCRKEIGVEPLDVVASKLVNREENNELRRVDPDSGALLWKRTSGQEAKKGGHPVRIPAEKALAQEP